MRVQFLEAKSEPASNSLRQLAAELRSEGVETSLLASEDQPGLLLLVVRGAVSEIEVPNGVRHWRFRETGGGP